MVTRRTVLLASLGTGLGALAGCTADQVAPPAPRSAPATPATPNRTPSASRTPSPQAPSTSPTATGRPRPEITDTVADGLDVPWGLAFLPGGDALLSERNSARLKRVSPAGKVTTVGEVAGVDAPSGSGEGGLLGIALAPGDQDTLFAYLTSSSDNRVVRIDISGGRVRRPKAVLTDIPTSVHHHGGRLLFDTDGLLYVATGDAEQRELAQRRSSLAGKILRIRPDGRAAPGNPFGNRTYSYGHRNVEGLAFDASGRLWATEFGDKRSDELNLIRPGRNYGWPRVEGASDEYEAPKAVWTPTSSCSPAGLAITRSTAFVGALRGQCLFAVPLEGTRAGKSKAYFAEEYGRIRGVSVAPDGALWMTTSNTDGRLQPGRNDDKILRVRL